MSYLSSKPRVVICMGFRVRSEFKSDLSYLVLG